MLFISVLVTIFMTILKAYVWLLKQMFRLIWNVYKLFLCLFPAAGIVLAALVVFECAGYFTGSDYIGQVTEIVEEYVHAASPMPLGDFAPSGKEGGEAMQGVSDVSGYAQSLTDNITSGLSDNIESGVDDITKKVTNTLLESATSWWEGILEQSEQKAYSIIAWAITILIGIPIFLGLLLISAAASGIDFIGIAIICDLVLYIARSIFGMTSPFKQFRKRYCFLFHTKPFYDPRYEDSYQDWLKRHHDEFENDTFGTKKAVNSDYDPDEDYDRMGYRNYEGRRVTRKEAARINRLKKRQQKYDEYYDDYYDRLEDEEEAEYDRVRTRRDHRNSNYQDDYYNDDYYNDEADHYDSIDDRNDRYYDDGREDDYEQDSYDDDYYEEKKSSKKNVSYSSFDFFAGCKTRDGVVKKYHSLAKLYHPDNLEGDSAAILEINRQYKEAMRKYK